MTPRAEVDGARLLFVSIAQARRPDGFGSPPGCATVREDDDWCAVKTIFDLLEEIESRPTMYVSGSTAQQLRDLELLLGGYVIALEMHGVAEPGGDFLAGFGQFLYESRGWSASCGPVQAIRDQVAGDDEAWRMVWILAREYREKVLR
jgi:hypothetical protein